ncbi:MAG: hypothetical protein ACPG7W_03725 [Paracoccaceae bacterium]
MRSRALVWAPVVALAFGAGALGLMQGARAMALTEGDVIERVAAQYLRAAGPDARRTDCVAVPGQAPDVWIVVRCGTDAPMVVYINHRGADIPAPASLPEV